MTLTSATVGSTMRPSRADFSQEIQALRALAVLLVVVFHLWPNRLTGGFVGVDVFFTISGFLITGHLLREAGTGRIRLSAFWARRVRRLLPAAFLVLVVSLGGTLLFMPSRVWKETATQIGASALGIQNWVLAGNSVDYFGKTNQPTLVQHYWSLSLEEQFYLFWPIALFLVFLAARHLSAAARFRLIGGFMLLVFGGSFGWSIFYTSIDPSPAYFSTFTHGWEFAIGGLLAVVRGRVMSSRWGALERTRALFTWIGILAILAAAILFTGHSGFPGWIALLPIGGTLAVIAAGHSESRIQRILLLGSPPVQFVGGASYSIYLWHWPIVVAAPFVLGAPLGTAAKLAIFTASLLLGWLTKILVEDPARRSRALNHRLWINYGVAAVAIVLVVGGSISVGGLAVAQGTAAQFAAREIVDKALQGGNPCFGAAAMTRPKACPESHIVSSAFGPDVAAGDWGTIAGVTKDGELPPTVECVDFSPSYSRYLDCTLGNASGTTTIAVAGDSHALALLEPLVRIAEQQGWKVRAFLMNSCTPGVPEHYSNPAAHSSCNDWREAVGKRIAADQSINMVVATGFSREEPGADYVGTKSTLSAGYAAQWTDWAASGKRVFVVEDVPLTSGVSVPDCIAASSITDDPCTEPRSVALAYDPLPASVTKAGSSKVSLINLSDKFCGATTCHSVVGGVIAYRDSHHLTGKFALTLIPALEKGLGLHF